MQNNFQKTLTRPVSINGVGLHTGIKSKITIKPALENAGLFFTRIDLDNEPIVEVDVNNVSETNRGTVLQKAGFKVHTVEHVLSALYGSGVDNANIEIDGPEPPILDGSALPFINLINDAGIKQQKVLKKVFIVNENVRYAENRKGIEINILPYDNFKITFFMDYGLPNFGIQYSSVENVEIKFQKEIAPARTFGLLSEIFFLRQNGLIKGGSLENSIVFVDKEITQKEQDLMLEIFGEDKSLHFKKGEFLNAGGLRFDNEPVRHKVLDLIGDLALFGKPIVGHVIAKKSGHSANIKTVKELRNLIK